MVNFRMVEDAGDNKIDQVVDRLCPVIKTGHRWQDGGSGQGGFVHVLQVDQRQRCFPGYQDERTFFLEMDIRGAMDQVAAGPVTIPLSVLPLQGQTIIDRVRCEPLAIGEK